MSLFIYNGFQWNDGKKIINVPNAAHNIYIASKGLKLIYDSQKNRFSTMHLL